MAWDDAVNRFVEAGCSFTHLVRPDGQEVRTEQPLFDLTCQNLFLNKVMKGGPATETKYVRLCNCKQMSNIQQALL